MSMPIPEIDSRPRDELTDRLIKEALEDEERRKRAKKGLPPQGVPAPAAKRPHKGKTLGEIEEEEGGPVRESLVGMAHTKRAQRRRAGAVADETELPDDIAAAEEFASGEEEEEGDDDEGGEGGERGPPRKRQRGEDGKAKKGGGGAAEPAALPGGDAAPLTAFNLNEERQEGHFDEEGNFVFDKGDAGDRDDEWLRSDEGKAVMSEELRKRVEAQHAAMSAADAAPVMGEAQVARCQLEMSKLMAEGETVAAALRRLRGGDAGPKKAMGKREKARLAKLEAERAAKAAAKGGAAAAAGPGDAGAGADVGAFARLTELADGLVSAGELDVYSSTREQLARWAALVLPRSEVEGGGGGAGGAGTKRAAVDDDDDDMFADDDGAPKPAAPAAAAPAAAAAAASAAAPAAAAAAPPAPAPAAAPARAAEPAVAGDDDGYDSWPIKELRRFLQERGEDTAGIVEKADLVARVRAAAAKGPARTGA
ncbi:hypothetical protein Rsub_07734 [Raphidocelis subcapitata]|uniref:Uncharacterized protein n=1 Tax=Raphidocelis subcapitata TaxID=307507 RepID=A0A2V0PB91_9CHLO|nr:hypothetical protein Rsub_07734 [Raphidocelis subcapitata]|eukprot:GBF95150.1 hypothetical protein Rsub_07734 [Raphidocelis subcapitata]